MHILTQIIQIIRYLSDACGEGPQLEMTHPGSFLVELQHRGKGARIEGGVGFKGSLLEQYSAAHHLFKQAFHIEIFGSKKSSTPLTRKGHPQDGRTWGAGGRSKTGEARGQAAPKHNITSQLIRSSHLPKESFPNETPQNCLTWMHMPLYSQALYMKMNSRPRVDYQTYVILTAHLTQS